MTDARQPQRILMPDRYLCETHYRRLIPEHHRSGLTWQARYTMVGVEILQRFVEDPRIQAKTHGDVAMFSALLSQHVPLCCFLGEAVLRGVTEAVEARARETARRLRGPNA